MTGSRRILVIQTAFPGDSVLALPFIQEVKRLNPGHEVEVVCAPVSAEIFEHSPAVSVVHPFLKRGEHKGSKGLISFASSLRERKYEKIYSLHRSFRTTLLVSMAGVDDTTGFDTSAMSFLYSKRVKYNHRDHEVKRNLNMLGEYEEDSWKLMPEVVATPEEKSRVETILNEIGAGDGFLIIAPGSVWETKRYPLKSYAEVASDLSSKGHAILISGSKAEREMGEEIVRTAGGNVKNICGELSIVESIELMRRASLVITNDSAPTHFAMAAGVPVLTIYCSTVPEFGFYGYSADSHVLSKSVDCKPCGIHGHKKCPNGSFECGTGIYPYEVITKVNEILMRK